MRNLKSETIRAFLLGRGWRIAGKNKWNYRLAAPTEMLVDDDVYFFIPAEKFEGTDSYAETMLRLVDSISILYNMSREELVNLFSQSLKEIKKDVAFRQTILAHAS